MGNEDHLLLGQRSVSSSREKNVENPTDRNGVPDLVKYFPFSALLITTTLSFLLLAASVNEWNNVGKLYRLITSNRATTQIFIQVLSNILGMIHVGAICRLFNYATRLSFSKRAVTLNYMRLWVTICAARIDWALPLRPLMPVLLFAAIAAIPSALWTGALTPVSTYKTLDQYELLIPRYSSNTSGLWKEWPSEPGASGPKLANEKGQFSYSPGRDFSNGLLTSASQSTPVNTGVFKHSKLDYSQFTYLGRSYGIGASAGLTDDAIRLNPTLSSYAFQEPGYRSQVTCIRNLSSLYVLGPDGNANTYSASGLLPNSGPEEPEFSVFFGRSTDVLVAMGVAGRGAMDRSKHIVALAAGSAYATLDKIQCSVDFMPTLFNVTVGLGDRNITVTPVGSSSNIEPGGNLTIITMRQLELLTNTLIGLYDSIVGDAFITSITNYNTSNAIDLREDSATINGMKNSIESIIDDTLAVYASAQLMIGLDYQPTPVTAQLQAIRFGQNIYVYAIVATNLFIIACITIEAGRTRGWKSLMRFDYMDPRSLVVWSSAGGSELAFLAKEGMAREHHHRGRSQWVDDAFDKAVGSIPVLLGRRGDCAIVVDPH